MTNRNSSFDVTTLCTFIAILYAGCGDTTRDSGTTTAGVTAGGTPWGSGGSGGSGSGGGDGDSGGSEGDSGGSAGDGDGDGEGSGGGDGDGDGDGDGSGGGGDGDGDSGIRFDIGDSGDAGSGSGGNGAEGGGGGEGCKYLDILFIVDISGSMSEEKANLRENFPAFTAVLDDFVADPARGVMGYRLGVTNSSFQSDGSTTGMDGALHTENGACGTGANPWLEGPAPGIADNFSCLANNPRACGNSCADLGRERPLDTMMAFADKHAVGEPNQGFYRGAESLLVIVTLTDEDDHSEPTTAAQTKARLDTFAQGEERYVVVTIAGPANRGCTSAFGDADATPRLSGFTNSVPNGYFGDICQGDLAQPLADALDLIKFSCDELPPPVG